LASNSVSIGEILPDITDKYDLVILWSYKKIVSQVGNRNNVILFHSSDLPEGKGWAPIYNAITHDKQYYTISGLFAGDKVDEGDIIVKARFQMKDNYTASYIRKWDHEISIMLISKILERFNNRPIQGIKQDRKESFYKKRNPEDNEISVNTTLNAAINHLRACEGNHPAFFYYNSIRYNILIEPAEPPSFPDDLEIIFFDNAALQSNE